MSRLILPVIAFLISLQIIPEASSENILVIAFVGSKSHKNAFEPLFTELAKRGHKLTIIHPVKSGYKDIKEISGIDFEDLMKEDLKSDPDNPPPNLFDLRLKGLKIRTPINPIITPYLQRACDSYYTNPEVMEVMKKKFALVLVPSHMNECTYGFVHHLNTSFIFIHPHPMEHYKLSGATGFLSLPSFTPSYTIGQVTDEMNLTDRIWNFLAYKLTTALYEWYYIPRMEETYRQHLGPSTPSIREIERNASLVLNNAHFSLTLPRPQLPQVIDLAGMHCTEGKPLPKELEDFLGNEDFIYFSLGSHLKASLMPKRILEAFVQAFSEIGMKVLWKFDQDFIQGLSKNVKLVKWAPQQDLLAHPKIRAFVSHGGLLSTEESAFHGVPLIGIPIFGDQISHFVTS